MKDKTDLVPYGGSKQGAKVITVSGSKGGIGKTFFAINFAVVLKNRGFKVLVFDADINMSNVNLFLRRVRFRTFSAPGSKSGILYRRV